MHRNEFIIYLPSSLSQHFLYVDLSYYALFSLTDSGWHYRRDVHYC